MLNLLIKSLSLYDNKYFTILLLTCITINNTLTDNKVLLTI